MASRPLPLIRARDWRDERGHRFTTVWVEAEYRWTPEGRVLAVEPTSENELLEIAPWKAHAELVLVGLPDAVGLAGFSVARGSDVKLWKRLVRLERGGPLVHPDPDAAALCAAATFGEVGPAERARWLSGAAPPDPAEEQYIIRRDLDLRFFQSVPRDQWAPDWQGGERILVDAFGVRRTFHLPAVSALASVGANACFALRADTLRVDVSAERVRVGYRGVVPGGLDPYGGVGALRCALVPNADTEATLATPFDWTIPRKTAASTTSPAVELWSQVTDEAFAVGQTLWPVRARVGEPQRVLPRSAVTRRTLIAKATIRIDDSAGAEILPPAPLAGPALPAKSLAGSDHAPHKPFREVLLVGTAHPKAGASVARLEMTLAPRSAEGAIGPTFQKAILAFGPRKWLASGAAGSAEPFERLALAMELESDGEAPRRLENPTEAVLQRDEPRRPAGFGHGPAAAPQPIDGADDWPLLPTTFDHAIFQSALPDQRLGPVTEPVGAETCWELARFEISSVRPGGGVWVGELPGVRPRAAVMISDRKPFEVKLALDTLTFDADASVVHLVWRGSIETVLGAGREPECAVVLAESCASPLPAQTLFAAAFAARHSSWARAPRGVRSPEAAAFAGPTLDEALGTSGRFRLRNADVTRSSPAAKEAPSLPAPLSREAVMALLARGESVRGKDLSRVDLRDAPLAKADLRGAILAFAVLDGADLTGARLDGASLVGATLVGATLDHANLQGADLTGAKLARVHATGVDVRRAVLVNADLRGAELQDAEGARARLIDADASGASFHRAKLAKTDWTAARLEGCGFTDAVLSGARFDECIAPRARFERANLREASFESAELAGASFENADASSASWECANLSRANLSSAKLDGASLNGARLEQADLRGAGGTDLSARQALFLRANLSGGHFDRASLEAASFEGAVAEGTVFSEPDLWLADVRGTRLATLKKGR